MPGLPRRRLTAILAAAAIASSAGLWILLDDPGSKPAANAPASLIDTQPRGCLAYDNSAPAGSSSRAWAGFIAAAKQDHTLVAQRYSPPPGISDATLVNTLAQMRCGIIVTLGTKLSAAAATLKTPNVQVIEITQPGPSPDSSHQILPLASFTPESLATALLRDLKA